MHAFSLLRRLSRGLALAAFLVPILSFALTWNFPSTNGAATYTITITGNSLPSSNTLKIWLYNGSSWTNIANPGTGSPVGQPFSVSFNYAFAVGNYTLRATHGNATDEWGSNASPVDGSSYHEATFSVTNTVDTTAPTQPGAISFAFVGPGSFSASWGASTDTGGAVAYYKVMLRSGSANGTQIAQYTTTSTSYTFTGQSHGYTYGVAVQAVDNAPIPNFSVERSAEYQLLDTTPPNPPGSITLSNPTTSGFDATWGAGSEPDGLLVGYKLRITTVGLDGPFVRETNYTGTSCTVTGLQDYTTFFVEVRSINSSAVTSSRVSSSIQTLDGTPPTAPGAVTFSGITGDSATANWTAGSDPGGSGVKDYQVTLLQGGLSGTAISTVTSLTNSYPLTGLIPGTAYGVSVKTRDNALNLSTTAGTGTFSTTGATTSSSYWGTITPGTDPGTPASTAGVGTLTAGVSVDNKGAANVSIPLKIPPGRSGLQPALALGYSSGGGNGPLGLGWALSTGFPQAITRGRSILARDGLTQGVTFTAADKFYLDGKRLICVSGTYGSPGSVYRTEVDSFVTVTTSGTGANIETFVVTDKSGVKMTFGKLGASTDGYQRPAGATEPLAYTYAIKRVEDTVGNTVDFTYTDVANTSGYRVGEYVLSEIRYTGSTATAGLDKGRITFHYNFAQVSGSTERFDRSLSYIAGRAFGQSRRLDAINVEFDGSRVAYYAMDYAYGANGGPVHLQAVRPYLKDGTGTTFSSFPAITCAWSSTVPSYSTVTNPLAATGSVAGSSEAFAFADVNGDGREDFVDTRFSNTIKVSLANGTGFDAPVSWINTSGLWTGPQPMMKICDVNGDGRKDIIYGNPTIGGSNQLFVLVSTGTQFVPLGGGTSPVSVFTFTDEFQDPPPASGVSHEFLTKEAEGVVQRIAVADFTGDGLDDVLIHRYDGKLKLVKSTGTGFTVAGQYDVGAATLYGTPIQEAWSGRYLGYQFTQDFSVSMIPCDLNGDGLMDYAWIENKSTLAPNPSNPGIISCYGYKKVWAVSALPSGGFSAKTHVAEFSWAATTTDPDGLRHRETSFMVMNGDVNGDGLTDFFVLSPGNVLPASNDQGVTQLGWGYQRVLHPLLLLSTGASGQPVFQSLGNPLQSVADDANPYVVFNGQQVRPFFDKVSIEEWNRGYRTLGTSPQLQNPFILLAAGLSSAADNVMLADLNSDGRQDYVWYNDKGSSPGWLVMYSQGDTFAPPVAAPVNWGHTDKVPNGVSFMMLTSRIGLDLNGDGIPDYSYDTHSSESAPGIGGFHVSSGQPGARLLNITDGLGRKTDIAYKPITDSSIYTPGATVTYPIRELRNATYAVASVSQDSGVDGQPAQFSYQYSGNRLDLSGRGSLGFHSFITLDQQTGLFKYQFLAQSFPMTGLTHREETYRFWNASNTDYFRYISSHDNTVVFDKVATTGGATLWPFISKAIEYRWEDSTTAHFSFSQAGANAHPEQLFTQTKPSGAHIQITAESRFDNQTATQLTLPGVSGYNPSDLSGTTNTVSGTTTFTTFSGLPGLVTDGNLRKLSTDFGGGFTETVDTDYATGVAIAGTTFSTLTGRPQTVTTTVVSPGYGTEVAPVKRYTYWGNTPLPATEMVDATDNALDLTTTYTRDSRGRVTDTTVSNPSATGLQAIGTYSAASVSAFNDAFDLPTSSKDADPYLHTTTTAYHAFLGLPTSVTDVNGAQVTTAYDALGRTTNVTDVPKGLQTNTAYSLDGSQTVTPPSGVGGLTLTSVYKIAVTSTVKPGVTTYYDRLGRAIRTVKEGFGTTQVVTDTVYNILGQVVAVSNPYPSGGTAYWTKTSYDALGRVSSVTAPNGTVTTNAYQGRSTTVTVDAPNLGGVDPAAQANTTLVDAKGRTVKVWNADNAPGTIDNTTGGNTTPSIAFALDGFGRMRMTTLKGQTQTITATYDALGRQLTLNDPDKGNWTYLNNALGQVVSQTDARAIVTTSTFDHLGRPLVRTTNATGTPVETAKWYYFEADGHAALGIAALQLVAKGNRGWVGALQRDESSTTGAPGYAAANSAVKNLHYYDSLGRPQSDVTNVDGTWFYTYTTYDAYSRPSAVRHYWRPAGAQSGATQPYVWQDFGYSYAYDGSGTASKSYLTALTDSLGRAWWDTPSYDYMDRVTSVRKGQGATTTRTYRPEDGVLTAIATGTSGSIQNLSFNFDGLGNLTSRTAVAGTETYAYDNLNRLTTRNGTTIAAYDGLGNITSKLDVAGTASGTYAYDSTHPHAVASAFGYTLGYDASGNLLTRTKGTESWSFRYAGFDKPRWMAKVDGATTVGSEFLYNANRSRTIQLEFDAMSGGEPSHYTRKRVYGLGPILEANYDNAAASGSPNWKLKKVRIYVPGPDGVIGAREFDLNAVSGASSETALVYHYDHLGSIESITPFGSSAATLATDATGKNGRFSEDAWGQRRNPLTWSGAPTTTDDGKADSLTPRGFTGHEMLDDLGLVHMNGRIYDPLLGRFLSADTIVQFPASLQSYNRYSYVLNNPLTYSDPSGHFIPIVIWGVVIFTSAETATATVVVAGAAATPQGREAAGTMSKAVVDTVKEALGSVKGALGSVHPVPGGGFQDQYSAIGIQFQQNLQDIKNANATTNGQQAASNQVNNKADQQSSSPKPEVDGAKTQDGSSGGQMDPKNNDPKKGDKEKQAPQTQPADTQQAEVVNPNRPSTTTDQRTWIESTGEAGPDGKLKIKTADSQIPASLKKSDSYRSELGGLTREELQKMKDGGGNQSEAAGKMLKLIKERERLMEKK